MNAVPAAPNAEAAPLAVSVRGLVKRYGKVAALNGLHLSAPQGSIYGLIGQNGAGKSTTLRVLATLLQPDEGVAEIAGIDVVRRPKDVRSVLGYMPDFFGVYDDLTVSEYLEFYAGLHGIRGSAAATLQAELLQLVDLTAKRDVFVEGLSRGMQQRLCLARSLIHDPQVLLLDEPASGLDPVARVEMREVLKELSRMGKTVLISSHILTELADLCTHVGMVHQGQVLREGTVAEMLRAAEPAYRLTVLRGPERVARVLEGLPAISGVRVEDDRVWFHCEGGAEAAAAALTAVVTEGHAVIGFQEDLGSLEATFVQLARAGREQ